MSTFQCCSDSPIQWSLNQQNPFAIANWFYGKETHEHIENLDSAGPLPGPPYGDRYLGAVIKKCEVDPGTPKTHMSDIGYTSILDDTGAIKTCISKDYSSKGCKPPKGVDYGPCTLPMFAQHSWWARDWNSMTNDQIFDCCVAPQSDTRTYDCPPTYWGGSPFCLPVMLKNCTPTTWDITDNCDKYMAYFSGADTSAQEQVLTSALSGWVSGLNGGKPSSADPFVKTATKYCSQFPGLCDTYLQDACKNVTKDDLLNNPDLSKLCGCFMQDKEYMLPGIIPVECNGACAINNHPDINGVTRGQLNKISGIREPLVCDQSTCVIDDVSISMIDTQVDGKVQFNQLCGNCPDGDCTCVLNNISIYAANSVLGGDIDFSQSCSSCSQGAGKVQNPIGCNGGLPPSPVPPSISTSTTVENVVENLSRAYSSNKSFWIWGIVAVLMVIIGLIAFAYIQKRKGH